MNRVKDLIENMQLLSINVRQHFHKSISGLKLDVTYEMVKVLMILQQKKFMNQQQIADITFKNKASLTSLLDNMQKRGLIVRNEDQADRRNKIITLTSKGKDVIDTVRPVIDQVFELMYEDVSDKEIEVMSRIILKMNKAVE